MDGLADGRMKPAPRSTTTTTTLQEDVIGMNQSLNMKPAVKAHVPPCEGEEMSKEQQAVLDRYRERQTAIDREGVAKSSSAEQWKALDSCPVTQQDDTVY